jgi:hypothetical protein
MSIEQIKKQAKRLSRLLPAHLTANADPSVLSACQELAAQSNGYPSFHAASEKEGTLSKTAGKQAHSDVELALALADAIAEEGLFYWRQDPCAENGEVTLYFGSDDLSGFKQRCVSTSGEWDPSSDSHMDCQMEIAICLRECECIPTAKELFRIARGMFERFNVIGSGYIFGYYDENQDPNADIKMYKLI